MSLRAYAKRRGVSPEAVSKAVAEGRLVSSVVRVRGQPKIADAAEADREWAQNTAPRPVVESPADVAGAYQASRALREAAAARRETAQAELAELELAERRGAMIPAEQARADVHEAFSLVKTRLLGVPSRVGQRLAHCAEEVVPVVEELIREALEELASRAGGAVE